MSKHGLASLLVVLLWGYTTSSVQSVRNNVDVNAEEDPDFLQYLLDKSMEISKMGPADIYLANAVWRARNHYSNLSKVFLPVKGMHALHPVGSWRPATWDKTNQRKNAVFAAKTAILEAESKISEEMIANLPELDKMKSVTPFIAVPFHYCGWQYVLLEGNGRMKSMQLAVADDSELSNMMVEVELLNYDEDTLQWVQEGIGELWNYYVTEAATMPQGAKDSPDFRSYRKKIQEYNTFKVGLVKCKGEYGIFGNSPCPVEKGGNIIRHVPVGSLHGVSEVQITAPSVGSSQNKALKYALCDTNGEVLLDGSLDTIQEICSLCYRHRMCPAC